MSKHKTKFTVESNNFGFTKESLEIEDGDKVGQTDSPPSKPAFLFFDDKPFSEDQINID